RPLIPELTRPPIPILSRPWIPELFRPGCRALLAQEFDVGFGWRSILLRGSFGLFAAAFVRFLFPARGSGVCAGPFFAMSAFLAHAFAFELDPVRVMDDAVEDGVGIGGIADEIVPFLDGRLAGDDGGAAAIALLDEFEEVVAGRGVENLQTKIVEDEHLGADQRPKEPGMAAVAAGEREFAEQFGQTLIEHRAVVPAGLVAKRTSEPRLAQARFAAQDCA